VHAQRRLAEDDLPPLGTLEPRLTLVREADADSPAADSPARSLQARVAQVIVEHPAESAPRWAPRATLALSGGISLLLWAALAGCLGAFR